MSSSVSDGVAQALAARGVKVIFAITGAGNIALLDALSASGEFQLVFTHHEQAALMAANGYARVTGGLGVAVVTTGGGAANAFTGALSANMDSVPLLVIAGNESSENVRSMAHLRAVGVQGFDTLAAFIPATKWRARCETPDQAVSLIEQGATSALEARKGCVLIEIPMDIQRTPITVGSGQHSDSVITTLNQQDADVARAATELATRLAEAERPLLYFGNGVRLANGRMLAHRLVTESGVPFALSWSALDLFADNAPGNIGRIGIYGERSANIAVQRADLVVCIGTRLAIPQVGYDRDDFARNADVWVVDVDRTELDKSASDRTKTVMADASVFMSKLLDELASRSQPLRKAWQEENLSLRRLYPRGEQIGPRPNSAQFVHSFDFVEALSDLLPNDAVVVTDVGAGLLTGHYAFRIKEGQRLFTSQGLGEMGFGLPAAIGAAIAVQDRPVVCLNTDGGIMFNLQELQTLRTNNLRVKLVVFNNAGYGMIRFSQDALLDGRRLGVDQGSGVGFPDFSSIAYTFGLSYFACSSRSQIECVIKDMLEMEGSTLVEVVMDPEQRYLPKLGTFRLQDGTLMSPSLEDLDPRIASEELEQRLQGH